MLAIHAVLGHRSFSRFLVPRCVCPVQDVLAGTLRSWPMAQCKIRGVLDEFLIPNAKG